MDNRYDLLKKLVAGTSKSTTKSLSSANSIRRKGTSSFHSLCWWSMSSPIWSWQPVKRLKCLSQRLAQLAKGCRYSPDHLPQRPSVNIIITGTIRRTSRPGLWHLRFRQDRQPHRRCRWRRQLIGKGDMLVSYNGEITRLQCAFVDTRSGIISATLSASNAAIPMRSCCRNTSTKKNRGKTLTQPTAILCLKMLRRLIVQNQMGSTSLIQRRMKLGFITIAGRLMDQLKQQVLSAPTLAAKAREVLVHTDAELRGNARPDGVKFV